MSELPLASGHLLGFARLLRSAGFAVAPEQTIAFLHGVALLGPRSIDDVRAAALAALGPTPDRLDDFERLFRLWFFGDGKVVVSGVSEEEPLAKDDAETRDESDVRNIEQDGGEAASASEQLAVRSFTNEGEHLAAFAEALQSALPVRKTYRNERAKSRGGPDLRRSLRMIAASDGDVPRPPLRRRREATRRLFVLVDISGSMKQYTPGHMKLAHAIVQGAPGAEVFTVGTRLTRITRPLQARRLDVALGRVAELVEDWDGGTRIGPTLLTLLTIPALAALARGAAIVVLSDGLERGSHAEMEQAFKRLKARAFRLSLLTPLAADPRFKPRTTALAAVLPHLDDLGDGSGIEPVANFILSLAKTAKPASNIWREAS